MHIPAFALHAAIEHIRDIRVTPARNLKGLAREVTGRFTFWEKCHGLRVLARILAKLGSAAPSSRGADYEALLGHGTTINTGSNATLDPSVRPLLAVAATTRPSGEALRWRA